MRGCENADARTFEQEIEGTTNHLAGFLILRIMKALGPLLIGLLFLRSLQNIPKLQIDIPRIPDRCGTRIVPSGVLSNGKSRTACAAGVYFFGWFVCAMIRCISSAKPNWHFQIMRPGPPTDMCSRETRGGQGAQRKGQSARTRNRERANAARTCL